MSWRSQILRRSTSLTPRSTAISVSDAAKQLRTPPAILLSSSASVTPRETVIVRPETRLGALEPVGIDRSGTVFTVTGAAAPKGRYLIVFTLFLETISRLTASTAIQSENSSLFRRQSPKSRITRRYFCSPCNRPVSHTGERRDDHSSRPNVPFLFLTSPESAIASLDEPIGRHLLVPDG